MSRQAAGRREAAAGAATSPIGIGVLVAVVAAVAGACGSGAPEPPAQLLDSRVRDAAISVDGLRADWEGNLTRVGDSDVFAGFHRAGDALYVAIVSQDPGFDARVFRSGLTVWFDTAATRRRVHGIRFPVFGAEARERLRADTTGGRPDRARLLRAAGSDFALVTDSATEKVLSPGEAAGLEVTASVDRGLFTWEARVPLGSGNGPAYALPAADDDTISVGLQAGGDQGDLARGSAAETEGPAASDPEHPDSVAADTAGERGRPSRGGPGPFPGPGREVPELEIWTRVNLGTPGSG